MRFTIPDDQPDGRYNLAVGAKDSEGSEITDPQVLASLTREIVNDNPGAFEMIPDGPNSDSGTYHVGAPGQTAITVNLKDSDGTLLASDTAGFIVTTGRPKIGNVGISFEGLTPDAEAAPTGGGGAGGGTTETGGGGAGEQPGV